MPDRLERARDVETLGVRDYLDGQAICLIEWPERADQRLPAADIEVRCEMHQRGRAVGLRVHDRQPVQIGEGWAQSLSESAIEIMD